MKGPPALSSLPYPVRVRAVRLAMHLPGGPLSDNPSGVWDPGLASTAKRDQMEAAFRDADELLERTAADPSHVRYVNDPDMVEDIKVRLFATMADGHHWTICRHIKARPITPGITALAFRAVLCQPCAAGFHWQPPAEDADRCDMCGTHGHRIFWRFRVTVGPALVVGDICQDCAQAVRIDITKEHT